MLRYIDAAADAMLPMFCFAVRADNAPHFYMSFDYMTMMSLMTRRQRPVRFICVTPLTILHCRWRS